MSEQADEIKEAFRDMENNPVFEILHEEIDNRIDGYKKELFEGEEQEDDIIKSYIKVKEKRARIDELNWLLNIIHEKAGG